MSFHRTKGAARLFLGACFALGVVACSKGLSLGPADGGAGAAGGAGGSAGGTGGSGVAGATGGSGVAGATGGSGVAGATGGSGVAGATGGSGVAGATGGSGVAGATGGSGVAGATGGAGRDAGADASGGATAQVSLSVTVNGPIGTGSVVSAATGINCGSTCSAFVSAGTTVQLVASPTSTGVFQSWTGCAPTGNPTCSVLIGTTSVNVTATFKTKNGGSCGGTGDCSSGFCVAGVCCNSACGGACNVSCTTGTCQPQPARTACGSLPGPPGTGSTIIKICDGQGNCAAPTIQCPTGGGNTACDLNTNTCCYNSNADRDETCPASATSTCTFFGQNCGATADCPAGQYCCQESLPSGIGMTICTTASNCGITQYCDPNAVSSGCLQGSCSGHLCE